MKESELFIPIKKVLMEKLGCTEVYGEVADIDVLAIKSDADIAVELKTSLNWKVIEQAVSRKHKADYVFVGVPYSKYINNIALETLKHFNVGLITVANGKATIVSRPTRNNIVHKSTKWYKRYRDYVSEVHSYTVGGVKTGDGPTEYSHTMGKIKEFMKTVGWVTAQQIAKAVDTHYSDPVSSIRDTLRASWNTTWCEHKKEGNRILFRMKKTL